MIQKNAGHILDLGLSIARNGKYLTTNVTISLVTSYRQAYIRTNMQTARGHGAPISVVIPNVSAN